MGLIPFRGFVGSAFGSQSPNIDAQDLTNWYLEVSASPFAKKPTGLLPCPGFLIFCTLPGTPVRAIFAQNDRTFAVGGENLYEISRTGVVTARPMTTLATPSAPTVTNSPLTPALDTPATPVITHGGTLGATTYGYKVTATNALGETMGSTEGTSAYGNAVLSSTNYNVITWAAVTGATGYKVYRTTGPGSGVLIGVVGSSTLFMLDIGFVGSAASPPGSNTTGGVAGTTTYGYKVTAVLGLGETAASGEGVTNTGQATLSAANYNIVTWPAVPNAHSYNVYRTTGGVSPPVLLGSTTELTFNDTGAAGDSLTPPTVDTTGSFVLADDGMPAQIVSSGDAGNQLMIIAGGAAFGYDLATDVLAKVVDGATAGGYIGSYFVVLDAGTSTMKVSESLDVFDWDATQVYQRQIAGDRWLSMLVTSSEIWLMGSQSSEVWTATGDSDTRFAPFNSVFIEQGIIAAASLRRIGGTPIWLGQNPDGAGVVYMAEGYTPVRISTSKMEREIESFASLADAVAFTYLQEGHSFYVLTFPTDGRTWVFDKITGEWHRRGFFDPNDMDFTAYRPWCHAFAFGGVGFGMHLVGDRSSGVIAKMSPDYGVDIDGATLIRRVRQAPYTENELQYLTNWMLQIDLETGLGASSGQGSDPTVMVQLSKDGAKTWGAERWVSAGAQGESKTRVRLGRWGAARNAVFRMVVTDPIPWRIAAASFDLSGGTS